MTALPAFDYVSQDWLDVRAGLISALQSRFPEMTDEQANNNSITILECWAFGLTSIYHLINTRALNTFYDTLWEMESILSLAKGWGYTPRSSVPALVNLKIRKLITTIGTVTLVAGTRATGGNSNSLIYETLAQVQLGPDDYEVSVLAAQQESRTQTLESEGGPNQRYALSYASTIHSSVEVSVNSIEFARVDSLDLSEAGDRHFLVELDAQGRPYIQFGDGVQGVAPTLGQEIFVNLKTGGGAAGNVLPNSIRTLEASQVYDNEGNLIRLEVTNPASAYGGVDRESLTSILRRGPMHARTQGRSVAQEDFVYHVELLQGVQRAGILTRNENLLVPENTAMIMILAEEGATFDQGFYDLVADQVTTSYPRHLTLDIIVKEGIKRPVDHTITWFHKKGFSRTEVETRMTAELERFYGTDLGQCGVNFGEPVHNSVVVELLQSLAGVCHLELILENNDPDYFEIPSLGDVTFVNPEA